MLRNIRRAKDRRRAGFTVLEVTIAAGVLVVGVLGMVASLAASLRLIEVNRETMVAYQAARGLAEEMQNGNFSQTFANYNGDPTDDPGGAGTSKGSGFQIEGLQAACTTGGSRVTSSSSSSSSTSVGSIEFPVPTGDTRISESMVDRELGMPRDLNGDGVISNGPMTGTYVVLPVRIRVRWEGAGGTRAIAFHTLLMNR